MMKITVFLALFSIASAESLTTLTEIPKGTQPSPRKPGEEISYALDSTPASRSNPSYIPNDAGGNWGDNLWKDYNAKDTLVIREIQINDIKDSDQEYLWKVEVPKREISHIRILNIGRQRALVNSIASMGGSAASAAIRVLKNTQFRLLIEVYVK